MLKFQDNHTTTIATFEDFILTVYVMIDDLYQHYAPHSVSGRRHILDAKLSDPEIITISICGELAVIDSENAWYSFVKKNYQHLFPNLCSRSRFNRTRVCLKIHFRHLRTPLCGIFGPNSVNVVHYASLIRAKSPTKWSAHLTKSNFQTRPRRALLQVTELLRQKLLSAFAMPGSRYDAFHLLCVSLAEYVTAALFAVTVPIMGNALQKKKPILSEQLNAERVRVKSFQGLCTRLVNKILAHNLCMVLNYLFHENCDIGKIKHLIF